VVTDHPNASLAQKLGIKDSSSVLVLHAPKSFILNVGSGVEVRPLAVGQSDVVLAFFVQSSALDDQMESLSQRITPSGGLWIAWPKKASKMVTDMTDHVVRDLALPLGLVDNKVCAIDETWTGLRLVCRLSLRDAVIKK
jgi:hypothetical protein